MRRDQGGFTLYELLLTLALVSILVSLSVPAFSKMLARSRQVTELNGLFHAIHLARKESIRRRQVMTVCASSDGQSCLADQDWSSGWILFNNADRDSPPQVDPAESVMLSHRVDESIRIVANRRAFTLRATYRRATNGTVVVCDRQERVPPRALVISYTGRPRVAAERPDGTPYSCAD
jgi:type IV fimbrial biogenesis protein FimT